MSKIIEKRSFRLKTSTSDVINTNKTIITWNNLNLRVLLDSLYDKHKKFNIILKMITSFSTALTSTAANRQTKICLSGLNFLHNYDIEYKCDFNKAILIGRYFYNTSNNLLLNGNFNNYFINANSTQTISLLSDNDLFQFDWVGNNTTILNGVTNYNYTRPYPLNNPQVVAFEPGNNGTYLYTNVYLIAGTYTLSFYIAKRPGYTTTMDLNVYIDDTIILPVVSTGYGNTWITIRIII
jgi:hypothetical protein